MQKMFKKVQKTQYEKAVTLKKKEKREKGPRVLSNPI